MKRSTLKTFAGILAFVSAGISVANADSFRTVAFSGDAAPGTSSGINFSSLGIPVLNEAGQVAFNGQLTGTGISTNNSFGIWSEGGGRP